MRKKSVDTGSGPGRSASGYRVGGHIWVDGQEGTFLGVGRITLLEMIRDTGSITKAARSIKMSYRRAWEHVESMNRQAPTPLVTASAGGRGGGGATLTKAGENAIAAFRKLDERFRKFREKEQERIGLGD